MVSESLKMFRRNYFQSMTTEDTIPTLTEWKSREQTHTDTKVLIPSNSRRYAFHSQRAAATIHTAPIAAMREVE